MFRSFLFIFGPSAWYFLFLFSLMLFLVPLASYLFTSLVSRQMLRLNGRKMLLFRCQHTSSGNDNTDKNVADKLTAPLEQI